MIKTEAKHGNDYKDSVKKNKYLYKAAENKDIEAQFNIALLYQNGEKIEKNLEKAFYWYQKVAEGGYSTGQYNLGCLYYNSKDIEENLEKAFYWYQKAAENGNIKA